MYIAILGRQPAIGIAELERVFGSDKVFPVMAEAAIIETDDFDIRRLGGTLKSGKVVIELRRSNWSQANQKIIRYYSEKLSTIGGKITLGLSAYNFDMNGREVQKTGIILKRKLKQDGTSLRLIPNTEPALSTATSHHNKLGLSDNKIELIIVRGDNGDVFVAESTGSQNITAYAKRDQERPKRDAFVGMLPPKLAQIMINLAIGKWNMECSKSQPNSNSQIPIATILDPFCGTGVILQEALLLGYSTTGTDLSEKMINYSRANLDWLSKKYQRLPKWQVDQGDAMVTKWKKPIDAVVSETYLGQPFSAPPSAEKLDEVRKNCDHIVNNFLKNISPQIKPGTPLCIAIPAWRDKDSRFTHLPITSRIERMGFKYYDFNNVDRSDLLYFRPDQIVARELLVLIKT